MKVAAQIHVNSSLCLADDGARHTVSEPSGAFVATISNNPDAGPFARRALQVEMVFDAPNLDDVRDLALDKLVPLLNALAFTTGASFSDPVVIQAFDWTPGLTEREARYFSSPQASISTKELSGELLATSERVMAIHADEVSRSAMRWYRLGLGAKDLEEQFSYFWYAVEIVAEALKESGKIAPKCPQCAADLFCPKCNSVPMRRRFGTEAIRDLICSVAPSEADTDELVQTLSKIRNTLQHGRSISSISDRLPCTKEQAVNVLSRIAWRGITRLADQNQDPRPREAMVMIQSDDVINRGLTAGVQVRTQLTGGDPQEPDLRFAPAIEISLVVEGTNYTFDGSKLDDRGKGGAQPERKHPSQPDPGSSPG
ncbi:MAG: hypothetical protein KDE25_10520 [Novosphingobium sp.]|nr:hypothetical protein [Novosphingobium sp.]